MKSAVLIGLLVGAVIGGVVGWTGPSPADAAALIPATLATPMVPQSPSSTTAPIRLGGETTAQVADFFRTLDAADEAEMLARLRAIIADRTSAPALQAFYRAELTERLVALGVSPERLVMGDAREREAAIAVVVSARAARDSASAAAYVGGLEPGIERTVAVRALLRHYGESSPADGLAYLRAYSEAGSEAQSLFSAWAKNDPRAAVEAAQALGAELQGSFTHSPLYQWASDDPAGAWEFIEALPVGERDQARSAYLNALVNRDAGEALDELLTKPELADSHFASWIGRELASDPTAIKGLMERVPPGQLLTRLVGGVADGLAREDPLAALDWSEDLLPGERRAVVHRVFQNLTRKDPRAALELAVARLELADGGSAVEAVLRDWSGDDFEGAFTALTETVGAEQFQTLLPGLFTMNFSSIGADFGSRLRLLDRLEPGVRQQALRAAGANWGHVDAAGLVGQLDALPVDDRSALAEGMLRTLDNATPDGARRVVAALPDDRRAANARRIASALAEADPGAAAAFLRSLPATDQPNQQRLAANDLLEKWTYVDPAAAESFVVGMPRGERRDSARVALAIQLRDFDLDRATSVLSEIEASELRADAIRQVAESWRRVDVSGGRAALNAALRSPADQELAASVLAGGRP